MFGRFGVNDNSRLLIIQNNLKTAWFWLHIHCIQVLRQIHCIWIPKEITNVLKSKLQWEREREREGGVVGDTVLISGKWQKTCITLNFHKQCPLALLVNVCWRQGKTSRNGEVKLMRGGLLEYAAEEWSWIFRQTMNFKVVCDRLHYNGSFVAFGRRTLS